MKIIGYNCIPKSSILLVNHDLSALMFCKTLTATASTLVVSSNYQKRINLVGNLQCSVASRPYASNSVGSSTSKSESVRRSRKQGGSSSLYGRASLLEMKNERIATRARVYDFLRGIGIEPDELDGLELPVTVDVMKERVDFLHTLGLTIEDINNYPLVLGCSVKKNMIPVLDYLGKLGVRRSTLTEFLRRYPQVLHASVVVDLAPVVKHLEGMDIKPNNIPRVLEKYPEVLGYKLEGTMSTSVAYLVGIGVARREIGGILTRYPEILGMRVGKVIKPFVEYLESLGIPMLAVARLIEERPHILGFGLEEKVKPNVKFLTEFGVRMTSISSVIAQYPEIIGLDLGARLLKQQSFLNSVVDFSPEDFGKVVEKMPQIVSLSNTPVVKHVDFLKSCGFSLDQVRKMVVGCPQLLALNMDIMKLNFDYFQSKMGRELDELVDFPAFFTYGLESTIRPRHRMVAKKGLKCSLAWLLNCSDAKFEQRMNYDTIDMEEMEDDSSFDMNTLMEPRNEESDSDYDEDSDEEYL
ncbi:transcription termination factor MTERF4, chloroplastic [Cynara cardunculus var. scolymus]|nr:transcription termination factor MTERF4, chloroplastic [Cynara cardunculus var. scolymus]XP_024981150.1 transcription termination factor MTERF4, chloroplastic [Cynara cardunculus var. scolymus]